jgi:hypothetical protein
MGQECSVFIKYIFLISSGGFLAFSFFLIRRLFLFRLFLLFLLFNFIASYYMHSFGESSCFIGDKFFTLWVLLWMFEVPLLVGLYIYKLYKKRTTWSVLDRRKFIIAIGVWIIEFSMLLRFLKVF